MSAVADELIRKIADRIVREVDPAQIILFGSRARGDADSHSDVDLLIVQDRPFTSGRQRREQKGRLWEALARFDVRKDVLMYTPAEVEKWRHTKNHVIAYALREGKVVYERS